MAKTIEPNLGKYSPKPLSLDLVKAADRIFFLGRTFRETAARKFPGFELKMEYYSIDFKDIPDPFDGEHWFQGEPWPGKCQESYNRLNTEMREVYQPALLLRLSLPPSSGLV